MDGEQIKRWADQFTADLHVAGEPVPLDRVIARHLEAFADLRATGLTWRVITNILTRAGARRSSGSLISADHLRAGVSRLARRNGPPSKPSRRGVGGEARGASRTAMRGISAAAVHAPDGDTASSNGPSCSLAADNEKDLSDEELARALAKIRKGSG